MGGQPQEQSPPVDTALAATAATAKEADKADAPAPSANKKKEDTTTATATATATAFNKSVMQGMAEHSIALDAGSQARKQPVLTVHWTRPTIDPIEAIMCQ